MAEMTDPGVRVKSVLLAGLGLLAALLLAVLLAWLGWRHWRPNAPNAPPAIAISGPQLEIAPQAANAEFQRAQQAVRAAWGWVAGEPGIARIPLQQAEALLSAPSYEQRPGAALPLATVLRDSRGRTVRLADYFDGRPVLLVLGYYRCRNVCSLVFDDIVQAVLQSGAKGYRLLGVSIDPREGARDAAAREAAYGPLLGGDGTLALLTGNAGETARLARAVGFGYRFDAATDSYRHPAGFLVATPDGRVSRYFLGLQYPPAAMRGALDAAGAGGVEGGLAEQVVLVCARVREAGKQGAVLWSIRAAALLGAALLAGLVWRLARRGAP